MSFDVLISSNASSDVLQTSVKKLNNYDPKLPTNNLSATTILVLSSLLCVTTLVIFMILCTVFSRKTVKYRTEMSAEKIKDQKLDKSNFGGFDKSKCSDQPPQKLNTVVTPKGNVGISFMYFIILMPL